MTDDRALRILLEACNSALDDARAGGTWFAAMVPELERLCGSLAAELAAPS